MFSTHLKEKFCFKVAVILSSANVFNLDQSKNLLFGKELILFYLDLYLQTMDDPVVK